MKKKAESGPETDAKRLLAQGLVKTFCSALYGSPAEGAEADVAKGDGLDMFRQQLDEVLRDRGRVAHQEATLAINKADLDRLRECGSFIGAFGERLAAGLGMDKSLEGGEKTETVEKA